MKLVSDAVWNSMLMLFLILITIPKGTSFFLNPKVPALFIFGDSLLDAGTNNYINAKPPAVANFPPYGETYFHTPTGRFTDGRTIADFIAQAIGISLTKPYLEPGANHFDGANFASGGAGLLDSTRADLGILPLSTQIRQFEQLVRSFKNKLGHFRTQERISSSLFLIAVGSNDIGFNYLANKTLRQTVSASEFVTSLIIRYNKSIAALYQFGGRKFILFTLGPFGCSPSARLQASLLNQTGCFDAANQLALLFNAALENLQASFTAVLPDARIVYANGYSAGIELINQGSQYGFTNTINACCGGGPFKALIYCGYNGSSLCSSPSNYVSWDFVHPTEAAYHFIFSRWWSGNTSYIHPYNIRTLVSLK